MNGEDVKEEVGQLLMDFKDLFRTKNYEQYTHCKCDDCRDYDKVLNGMTNEEIEYVKVSNHIINDYIKNKFNY